MTKILSLLFILICVVGAVSQSAPAERRPRPIPPACCRPFKADDFSATDLTAAPHRDRPIIGIIGGPPIPVPMPSPVPSPSPTPITVVPAPEDGVDREEAEIYRLNLEEYRLTTEIQRKSD